MKQSGDTMVEVIQIGPYHWNRILKIPEEIEWTYLVLPAENDILSKVLPKKCDVLILDTVLLPSHLEELSRLVKPYTCFHTVRAANGSREMTDFLERKKSVLLTKDSYQSFVNDIPKKLFARMYGARFSSEQLIIKEGLPYDLDGHDHASLDCAFGDEFIQVAHWCYNLRIHKGESLDLWLEYSKDPTVDIRLQIIENPDGSTGMLHTVRCFQEELRSTDEICYTPSDGNACNLCLNLQAKGQGKLRIGALHHRISRQGAGVLLPGGKRRVDGLRHEIISYFDPMDRKPPLCVYFSGYRPAEGFEGLGMMRRYGAPFILFYDPRLEGGEFYLGSPEYKKNVEQTIRDALAELGFTNRELVLSGLSMGTFGAFYYGCRLKPYAIIAGKPLLSLGNVACNERILRPGGFPTSLDLLLQQEGGLSPEDADALNRKFWNLFDSTDLSATNIAISYMQGDDYDVTAYDDILRHLSEKKVRIVGKGIVGRHNDNTREIVKWFQQRYQHILEEDFGRRND